jgi:hypothetical protein
MTRLSYLAALLMGAAAVLADSTPALAQAQDEPALEEVEVIGHAPPGAVIGDIPPEFSLTQRDIRAYGVGTVSELLDELSLQTTSGQSRGDEAPVILVNGKRIAGVKEVSDLPTEAILRLDILPEEVALKYGYSAVQKVINVILRRRFAAVTGEASGGGATQGGADRIGGTATMTRIRDNHRLNIAVAAQAQGSITEAQRGIEPATNGPASDPAYRTLQPSRENYSANVVYAVPLGNTVTTSTNLAATLTNSRSLNGLSSSAAPQPLDQLAQGTTLHFGTTVNADVPSSWRLSWIGTYDHAGNHTDTERVHDAVSGALSVDRARSSSDSAEVSMLATRKILPLPAGDMLLSLQAGGQTSSNHSESTGTRTVPAQSLSRSTGKAQVSLDMPVTRRSGWGGAIGTLTANFDGSVTHVSDFDTLKTFGYGLNWSPTAKISIVTGISEDRRAPTVQQLINPTVTLVNSSVYDYATGATVLVTSTSGGNPLLSADDRRTFKLAATVKPFTDRDFTLTANYSDSRTHNAIVSLPGISAPIEAAFPDRFVRDEEGELVAMDVRPLNVASQERSSLRWGFNLTQVLREPQRPQFTGRPRPPRAEVPSQRPRADGAPPPDAPAPAPEVSGPASPDEVVVSGRRPQNDNGPAPGRFGGPPPGGGGFFGGVGPGGPGGRGGFGRGPGGGGGGDNGSRLQLSVYHTWLFRNEVTLRNGVAPINLLEGGSLGGAPASRHLVQANGGITDNGVGIRLSGQWRSAGQVLDSASTVGDLHFGALASLDLRLFADLGLRLPGKSWARGLRATLAVQNIFDNRQRVTNGAGAVPVAYQPGYLDPMGRVVLLSVRKIM